MNTSISRNRNLIAAAIGTVLALGTVAQASAQSAMERAEQRRERHEQRGEKNKDGDEAKQSAAPAKYANAAREEPDAKASAKMSKKLQKMVDLYDEDKGAEAIQVAEEITADAKANDYDKAFAAQLAAQAAYDADDAESAKRYLQQAIDTNGLDNNGHFGAMNMLAQLQLQDDQYPQALATIDRLLEETQSNDPESLVIKGNALYRMERYAEAATVLKQAIDASSDPQPSWTQLLMATYMETGDDAKASQLAADIGAKNPNDKRAQMNLAAVYQQGDQLDKAVEVLERLRAAGQFTDDKDYRLLYSSYLNLDGQEAKAAAVIEDGLAKGVLEPDYQVYLAQAQAYYFSDQVDPAVAAYQKAAPLAPDGEAYLNLAKVLWQEDRVGEAKAAAQKALDKGLKKPEDAKKILALPAG